MSLKYKLFVLVVYALAGAGSVLAGYCLAEKLSASSSTFNNQGTPQCESFTT